jgi:hypothetical protein
MNKVAVISLIAVSYGDSSYNDRDIIARFL